MVNRAHDLGCFHLPNGQQVLTEDDVHNVMADALTDVMLEGNEGQGFWRRQGLSG